jgi:hypothetical protein
VEGYDYLKDFGIEHMRNMHTEAIQFMSAASINECHHLRFSVSEIRHCDIIVHGCRACLT